MPCTFSGSIQGDRELSTTGQLTKTTKMLCRILAKLENDYKIGTPDWKRYCDKEITEFWKHHKKLDEEWKRKEEGIKLLQALTEELSKSK